LSQLSVFDCIKIGTVSEFDLEFLKVELNNGFVPISINENIDNRIPEIDTQCIIIFSELNENSDIEQKTCDCIIKNIECVKLERQACPYIPIIEVEIELNFINLNGLSGSLVINKTNNKIIGMVKSYNEIKRIVCVIPIYLIIELLSKNVLKKQYEIVNIPINGSINDVYDPIANKMINGLFINHLYNINYKRKNKNKLVKSDIITSINGLQLNKNGCVYCEQLDKYIPYDTYIAINCSVNEPIKLKIYREKKKHKNSFHEFDIYPETINNISVIPYMGSNHIIKYNGIIFAELSEKLLKYYFDNGIKIIGYAFELYSKMFISQSKKQQYFVVVGIDESKVSSHNLTMYRSKELPLVKDELTDNYILPILSKINDKAIKTFDDIIYGLKNVNELTTLSFVTKYKTAIKIIFKQMDDNVEVIC
jgi:hypothetical protein